MLRRRRTASSQHRLRSVHRPRGPEPLERRLVLTANLIAGDFQPQPLGAVAQIDWHGRAVDAYQSRWIVNFDAVAAGQPLVSLVETTGGQGWSVADLGSGFYSLATPGVGVDAVSYWAAEAPGVVFVEPDFLVTPTRLPNDPSFSQLWGLSNLGQSGGVVDADIDAPEAWTVTTGSRSVVIAVVDSGVDITHPDLAANIWRNPAEIAGNGIDDDGNGFVDDVNGWDFVSRDNTPQDGNGHGTHVAGTIGAVGNNGRGIVGVNWEVSILPLRFLDNSGSGSTSAAIAAINYATALRLAGVNVVASNHSWSGGGYSSSLRTAISRHNDAGIMFIAAAGNEARNNDAIPSYPANYDLPNVISVAALDRSDQLASFSNYGRTSVDLGAPGVSIYSTTPGNGYSTYSGTSMAAPHVTGVVGLLAAARPQATVAEIRAAILDTVVAVSALGAGRSVTGGRLNAAAALERIAPAGGPQVVSVSPAGVVPPPVTSLQVVFDTEILATTLVAENFQLVAAGGDTTFGTADDVVVAVPATGIGQSPAGTVTLVLRSELPADSYRLTLRGGGSNPLRNLAGVPLLGGEDAVFEFVVNTPAPPPPVGPNEPNDSLATASVGLAAGAVAAALNGEIGDGANASRDVDLFSVVLSAGDVLEAAVRAQANGATLDSYLRLFDASGQELAANDDFGGSLDSSLAFTATTAGVYYVGVSGYGNARYAPLTGVGLVAGSVGSFELLLRRTAPEPLGPLEPNDSLAAATVVSLREGSAELAGLIGDGPYARRDVDLFVVALNAGDTLTVTVSARDAGSSLDSYLRLFDPAGQQLAINDDFDGSLDSRIEFTADAAGRYLVGLSGYRNSGYSPLADGSGTPGSTGSYRLAFTVVGRGAPAPAEPNDTLATASVGLATGGDEASLVGVVGDGAAGSGDVDLYSVTLAAGQVLTASVRARVDGSTLDSYARIFDASGMQRAFNDDSFGSQDSRVSFAAAASGTYFVGVSGYGNSRYAPLTGAGITMGSTGSYTLRLARVTPPLESNDSIAQATVVTPTNGAASVQGVIGDGVHGARDVDLFAISLVAGQMITLDVTARDAGSTLDSYLRLFDAAGQELAANDDSGESFDSYLQFTAASVGTYYVGLSGFRNSRYVPTLAGSGVTGSTGSYRLDIQLAPTARGSVANRSLFSAVAAGAAGVTHADLFRLIALLATQPEPSV